MSGLLGDVGALLSVVTSEAPFQDAFQALEVLYEGGFSRAALTLKRLLQARILSQIIRWSPVNMDGMLYSTTHQLQAVSLLYLADHEGSVLTLKSLAAKEDTEPAVATLATTLLEHKNLGSPTISSIIDLTPGDFIKKYEMESGSRAAAAGRSAAPVASTTRGDAFSVTETLESLGIAELPGCEASIYSAARGPLLPKDETAAIAALKQQVQVDELAELAATVKPTDVAAAANHNPELASEVIATALALHESNTSVSGWAGACLWALAASETTGVPSLNLMTCWAKILDKVDMVEPSSLAAFISYSIQHIISIEDRVASNRSARMLAHLLHRIIDKENPAILIVAVEVEGFCTQFVSQEVCATLYAKLAAMS